MGGRVLRVCLSGYAETGDGDLSAVGFDAQELLEERWFVDLEHFGALHWVTDRHWWRWTG